MQRLEVKEWKAGEPGESEELEAWLEGKREVHKQWFGKAFMILAVGMSNALRLVLTADRIAGWHGR